MWVLPRVVIPFLNNNVPIPPGSGTHRNQVPHTAKAAKVANPIDENKNDPLLKLLILLKFWRETPSELKTVRLFAQWPCFPLTPSGGRGIRRRSRRLTCLPLTRFPAKTAHRTYPIV